MTSTTQCTITVTFTAAHGDVYATNLRAGNYDYHPQYRPRLNQIIDKAVAKIWGRAALKHEERILRPRSSDVDLSTITVRFPEHRERVINFGAPAPRGLTTNDRS